MWIDTHCHLDAAEFGSQALAVAAAAQAAGVQRIVIPAIHVHNFSAVQGLAHDSPACCYALGIHPICVPGAGEQDLARLRQAVHENMDDPRFVAIGEIGLDFFIPELAEARMREKQEHFYSEQLKLARDVGMPVLLHVRRSQDIILKYLRRIGVPGGIAHAFNGSFQQAQSFIDLGLKLGFGGAMTFTRALQIRRLATGVPLSAIVLETDAPDIPPAWISRERNSPQELPRIGAALAQLRGIKPDALAAATGANACAALPRLSRL